ncbi:aldolase [Pseudorhodoferax sp. Leaf274]|uniref:aldolase n=1 Tax=Pseudorhodoferax sp. Leaf274 TaxID=1736318 RepID=UPI000703979D|nr:aldolase [Pseudorhodoferax sp. Leaf274]KQP44562.1 aldolase [Pseudorhodoferax sp. Leaf274]
MQSEQDLKNAVYRDLQHKTTRSSHTPLQQLVLASRMLAAQGHWANGLAGQITARGEEPGTYRTLKFGIGADEATPDSFILTDDDLRPLDGHSLPNPATRFHLWVYRHHPEVNCIVHTHPAAVSALSMIGQPLAIACMDATPFYENCGYLADWPGLPITNDEGRIISGALGSNKSLLLAHHGLLTAGATVAEAAVLAIWMEQAAAVQLRAAAAGTIRPVPGHLARESRDFLLRPEITDLTFQYFARQALRNAPDCLASA